MLLLLFFVNLTDYDKRMLTIISFERKFIKTHNNWARSTKEKNAMNACSGLCSLALVLMSGLCCFSSLSFSFVFFFFHCLFSIESSIRQMMSSKVVYNVVMKWMSLCRCILNHLLCDWVEYQVPAELDSRSHLNNFMKTCLFNLLFGFSFQVLLSLWNVANKWSAIRRHFHADSEL